MIVTYWFWCRIFATGFRVDACKHMWPAHLEAIYEGMTLPGGGQPFIYNEVSFENVTSNVLIYIFQINIAKKAGVFVNI